MVKVGQTSLEVVMGDIADSDTEAVVNAANDRLWMGSVVAGAIKRNGGKIIEDEAVALGPIPIGEAVVTSGGNLKDKYVIHAAGMGQELKTDEETVKLATKNSLHKGRGKGDRVSGTPRHRDRSGWTFYR